MREVLKAVQVETCCSFAIASGPRRYGDPAELVVDASLLMQRLAWRPEQKELRDIVRTAWAFEQLLEGGGGPQVHASMAALGQER